MRVVTIAIAVSVLVSTTAFGIERRVDQWIDTCEGTSYCSDFRRDWPRAFKGDPDAQKNMTFYFSTGASGAIKRDLQLACAWEIVLLAARHEDTAEFEASNLRTYCSRSAVGSLDRPMSIAGELFAEIYGRPLPPPPWEWAPPVASMKLGDKEGILRAIVTASRVSALCAGSSIDQVRVNAIIARLGVDPKEGAPGGKYDSASIRAGVLKELGQNPPGPSNCRNLTYYYGPSGMTVPGIAHVPLSPTYPD